jgi:molecular chaperone HtpG
MSSEKHEFKTEVKQLLDLMIHSLYSHKEIFLRELISNASDAIDKARYESLTDSSILEDTGDWKIRITPDRDAGTLTVSDNGTGMAKEEIIEALGTIAHSGTKEFLLALRSREVRENPELIGQFGVGFYSSFMVADKVTVLSRKAGKPGKEGVKWESTADGSFITEGIGKESPGTDVILHIKKDEEKYLQEWELRNIVRKYSDYIEHPVVMEVEKETELKDSQGKKIKTREEETLNSRKALWLKDKPEIGEDEYNEFYKHISHDFTDPARVIHFRSEGTSEFTALLFIPSKAPFGIFYKDFKIGPTLYVRRVQIMDHCEDLIPPYLRFIKGVVDSSDLPLNISREMLQANRQVDVIRKSITKRVLDTLADMKRGEYVEYLEFYKEFGRILKEGIHFDFARKEQIADLLLFPSTKTDEGGFTDLEKYVDNMKPGQDEIYYITATSLEEAKQSPYLEAFREKDYEVLIMLDEIDDVIMSGLHEFKGKKLKSAIKGDIRLDKAAGPDRKETEKKFEKLISRIKDQLKDEVKDVRLSGRLKDSACCLVTPEGGMDPQMEKILKAMGQETPSDKRIFEINPDHQVFDALNEMVEQDGDNPKVKEYIDLLYDQALLIEGSKPKDPAAFARNLSKLIVENTRRKGSDV